LNGSGVVFKLMPDGENSPYSVLYNFCAQDRCKDGAVARAIAVDGSNRIVGVTQNGGGHNIDRQRLGGGTVFRFVDGQRQMLHRFQRDFTPTLKPQQEIADAESSAHAAGQHAMETQLQASVRDLEHHAAVTSHETTRLAAKKRRAVEIAFRILNEVSLRIGTI